MGNLSLLFAMLKNIRSGRMNRGLIGFTVEEHLLPVESESFAVYASATRDSNPQYTGTNAVAPPLFLAKLIIPLLTTVICHPELKLNLLRMVHAGQSIRWHRPVRAGQPLSVTLSVEDIRETSAGELLVLKGACVCCDELAVEGMTHLLVRRRNKRKQKPGVEPGSEAFRFEISTHDGQPLEYASASGDRNYIHTSEFFARSAGLPRTIMHGACVMAMVCGELTRKIAGYDISRLISMDVRFARPVIPGETLTLVGFESKSPGIVPFEVRNPKSRPVLKNGIFRIES